MEGVVGVGRVLWDALSVLVPVLSFSGIPQESCDGVVYFSVVLLVRSYHDPIMFCEELVPSIPSSFPLNKHS